MAEQPEVSDNDEGAGDLRGKLIGRLAVAGLLVALLLGVLAFFDHLANPPEEPDEPVFSERVPVAPKKEMSQPVKPAENLPEPPAPEKAEPPVEPPPPPQVEAKPQATVAPEAAPEKRPAAPIARPTPAAPSLPAVPEATSAPSNIVPPPRAAVPSEPVPARPSAQVLEHKPAPVATPSGVSRLFSGFLLQAGVFTSVQRAEELHARLTLSGVPSTLETRVQVGPFRTRQEAEAAQAKLKELGVETILVPPKGKN
jgi:DedD protein